MAVAAGMIAVLLEIAVVAITLPKMASTGRGPAAHQILQGLLLAGQKSMALSIGRSMEAENIRHLDHDRFRIRSRVH
jgi:hypothetical protein